MYITRKYDSPQSQKLKITKIDDDTFEYKFNYDRCINHSYFDENVSSECIEKSNNTFKFIKHNK